MVTVSNVTILSRTKMSGDKICVGGYCSFHQKYVRLLSNTAQALHVSEPYQIGEVYELTYAPRYANQMDPPHVEDIAVYERKYLRKENLLSKVAILSIGPLHIENLFEKKLNWENSKGYLLKSAIPASSVAIARLSHSIEKKQFEDDFSYTDTSGYFPRTYAVKYVGEQVLREDIILPAGTPIRFSLARWWDKNKDGNLRSYLQLSGFYV